MCRRKVSKLDRLASLPRYEAVDRLAVEHRATLGVAVREEHAQIEVIEVHLAKVLVLRVSADRRRCLGWGAPPRSPR